MARHAGLVLAAAVGLVAGCGHARDCRLPSDPLLLSKSPVEARAATEPPPMLARHEPPPPEGPAVAYAAAARARDRAGVEAIPALASPLRPVPVLPASNPRRSDY